MKLIIDIPEEEYKKICKVSDEGVDLALFDHIAAGTPFVNVNTPQEHIIAKKPSEYIRKGYYNLTEENYWYLKDITFYKSVQIQDYLNYLLEKDREQHKDILNMLPHFEK
ncbi:MAG: hypothetical protein J6W64_01935 [Bacilli bacterium]|nr:hypothetical protein [Bacilli bacterium]